MIDEQPFSCNIETQEDCLDILFRELELAIKWQLPSILLAIYSSESVYLRERANLENQLLALNQKVSCFHINDVLEVSTLLSRSSEAEKTVIFVDGFTGERQDWEAVYRTLNHKYREALTDQRMRIVFWLTEDEVAQLARYAPDFWAFRQRSVELQEPVISQPAPLSSMESDWKMPASGSQASAKLEEAVGHGLPSTIKESDEDESLTTCEDMELKLGLLNWRKGDNEKAIESLQKVLEVAMKRKNNWFKALCFNAIALVKTDLGKTEEAIEAYEQAMHFMPDRKFLWSNLGNLYSKLNRNDEARAAFQNAVEYNPEDAVGWNGLGNTLERLGQMEDALSAYRKAIEITPNYAQPWNGLGNFYASTGQTEQAIDAYQKAIELDKRLVNPWIRLGNILEEQNRDEEAIAVFKKAIELDPKNAQIRNGLGNACLKTEAYEQAIEAYKKAMELDPRLGQPCSNLASAFVCQGRCDEAIPLYHRSIRLLESDREKAFSWNKLGNAYRRLGDYENAMIAYHMADELYPDTFIAENAPGGPGEEINLEDTQVWNEIGRICFDAGAYDQAIEAYNKAIELDPGFGQTYSNLAKALTRQGRITEAILTYKRSIELLEDNRDRATSWNKLGDIYRRLGDMNNAMNAYEMAVELDPGNSTLLSRARFSLLSNSYVG